MIIEKGKYLYLEIITCLVCNALQGPTISPLAVADVLDDTLIFSFFSLLFFQREWPECNKPAHMLSHHAKFVVDFKIWVEETPSFLETAITSDVPDCF